MPYYIPKRKMFISKANPDDKREFFSGFNICYGRNQKNATFNVHSIVSFALKRYDKAWTEGRPDEIKLFILQIQLRIIFSRYTLIRIISLKSIFIQGHPI